MQICTTLTTFALYFSFAVQPQVGTYNLSDLAAQLQILALWLLLLLLRYSCCKTHLCTFKCRRERAEPGAGLGCEWRFYWSMPDQWTTPAMATCSAERNMLFMHMYQFCIRPSVSFCSASAKNLFRCIPRALDSFFPLFFFFFFFFFIQHLINQCMLMNFYHSL